MRCLTFAIGQWIRNGGYIAIRASRDKNGRRNPWLFHVLWAQDLVGVKHLTTDDPNRHWFKELLCALTGTHYIEKHDDLDH